MQPEAIILLASTTLFLSYISSLIYSKTRVPDILVLIGFGVLVGPVLDLVKKDLFVELAPLMSVLALSIILFEAGINVDILTLLQTMAKSTILSTTSIISVVMAVGLVLNFFMPQEFTLRQAMLLGAMIGGTSTVSVFGILSGLDRSVGDLSSTRVLLTMESVISDPVCIISSITLIRMIMLPGVSLSEGLKGIFSVFTFSSLFGLGLGLVWAKTLDRLRGRPFNYMITIAVLIVSYIASESVIGEGGGAMTALTFGLAITNYRYIVRRLGGDSKVMIDRQRLREFHEEVTFFIKSFFFVYIGLIVSLSVDYALIGMGVVLLIMALRFIDVEFVGRLLAFTREEKALSQVVYASGLPAFVMSQLPMVFDPDGRYFVDAGIYPDLCMPIVVGTVIYSALAGPLIAKRLLKPPQEPMKKGARDEKNVNPPSHPSA